MTEQKKLSWPAWVLALDLLGSFLVAVGIYAQVADGELLFSELLDLRAIAIPLIIVGALMIAPLVVMTVTQIRASR
ncbi:MAG: hypothetical protein QNJ14_03485 [Woeseiaceae bacterium]|nr:hypothetical protein [Woeseiaceae bacterium]